MPCERCIWWRTEDDAPTTDEGVPHYGTCHAAPPRPEIRLTDDPNELQGKFVQTVWPWTKPHDHCGGFVDSAWVDPSTGTIKRPNVLPPMDDDGTETLQ